MICDKFAELGGSLSSYTLGVISVLVAAVLWGIYGLLQKKLLRSMHSGQLTLLIYGGGALILLLLIDPLSFTHLSLLQVWLLIFCCLNMVVAYGAFTEALHHWQAAKVSAVISLAPIFTIISMMLAVWLWPTLFADSELNSLAYLGAFIVVFGSILTSFGKRN